MKTYTSFILTAKTVGFVTSVFLFYGCAPIVGGKCVYSESIVGNAIVKSNNKEACIVDFYPKNRIWSEWSTKEELKNIDAKCYGDIITDKVYNAVYKKELQGSCKPYRLVVYTEEFLKKHPNFLKTDLTHHITN